MDTNKIITGAEDVIENVLMLSSPSDSSLTIATKCVEHLEKEGFNINEMEAVAYLVDIALEAVKTGRVNLGDI